MKQNPIKIIIFSISLIGLFMFSETADRIALSGMSQVACAISTSDLCMSLTNSLSRYTPKDAAQIHLQNCLVGHSKDGCLNASILFRRINDFKNVVSSLSEACSLGDKEVCIQRNRASVRWISDSEISKVSAKEMRARLEFVFNQYSKTCEMGEGESCALAAKSPMSSAKSVYRYYYRGCYNLNHPTACIGLAEYFKARGQGQLARGAVSRVCKGKNSVACTDLMQRMSESKSAQARTPASHKYN